MFASMTSRSITGIGVSSSRTSRPTNASDSLTSPTVAVVMNERVLVTGAFGCIGAWVIRELVAAGVTVVGFDIGAEPRRLTQVMSPGDVARVAIVRGDITDLAAVETALDLHEITSVIHLAALQIPFCRADAPLGARVNVVGTVNVFEAAKRRAGRLRHVVYASSIAVYDPPGDDLDGPATLVGVPSTLYGVYKRANEATAHVYWAEHGLASIGLRPHTVYGPGRDQGVTSAPTTAMVAAAAGVPYTIPFGGRLQFQHTRDIARAFILASRIESEGAAVVNPPGHVADIRDVVGLIEQAAPGSVGTITAADAPLALPAEVDAGGFRDLLGPFQQTPLADGIAETIATFRDLLARGLVAAPGPVA
jgi:nucleoside-diphosphate-sugar epimerase